jgi:hypothetical protein
VQVYLVNESTALSDTDAFRVAWACDYQARFHYGRSGWRDDVRCYFAPGGANAKIPSGGLILHMLDTSDQQGALGYHDEDGNEVPFARVFVKTAQADGQQASEVASHELLEMATDPNINLTAPTGDLKRLYALEVGDPCQGNGYDVGAPEGRTTGVVVADFVTPAFFDPKTPATQTTDFRGALHGPFALGSKGYVSYVDLTNLGAGWQQQVGSERTIPVTPDRDDRLGRR